MKKNPYEELSDYMMQWFRVSLMARSRLSNEALHLALDEHFDQNEALIEQDRLCTLTIKDYAGEWKRTSHRSETGVDFYVVSRDEGEDIRVVIAHELVPVNSDVAHHCKFRLGRVAGDGSSATSSRADGRRTTKKRRRRKP